MNRSQSIAELAKALAKAQGQVKPALKDGDNPFFKTKYADFSSVLDACDEALVQNGLAIVQAPVVTPEGAGVETLLMHTSGEWLSETLVLPVNKKDAQGVGSCITYARRYALEGFLRIKREEDDGNAAAASVAKPQVTPEQVKADAETVGKWTKWLATSPQLDVVNKALPSLKECSHAAGKQAWALVRGYANEKSWVFDEVKKVFVPGKQQTK